MDMQERHLRKPNQKETYLRGFFGEYQMLFNEYRVKIYPIVKLYVDGSLIIHLRVLSPGDAISVESMIDNVMNLSDNVAKDILIDALACHGFLMAQYDNAAWWTRKKLHGRARYLAWADSLVDNIKIDCTGDNRSNNLVSFKKLSNELELKEGEVLHLRGLIEYMQLSIVETISSGTSKLDFLPSWFGLPTVHVISFKDQPSISDQFDDEHIKAFAKIDLRSSRFSGSPLFELGQDMRPFNDYSMWLSKSSILFALGSSHLEDVCSENEIADPKGQKRLGYLRQASSC